MNRYFDGISSFINDLTILDTHEHLLFSSSWEIRRPIDAVAYIIHYCLRDFLSAGLSFTDCERLRYSRELTVSEKFRLLKPYWHACKFSGFAQILNISVRDLYGIEEIGTCTIESLEQAYQQIFTHPRFKEVLRKKSKIHRALLDTAQAFQADRDYFLPVYRIDWLILLQSRKHLVLLEQESGRTIVCFDDYLDACQLVLDKKRSAGTGVFKCALAYQRSLFFSESSYTQAKKSFQSFFQRVQNIPLEENVPPLGEEFQNYMIHFILDNMNLHGMVLQIHTGIQEGSGNILYHSNPILLNSLFMKYPQVSFDLFHIGYPYQHELGALCKMFPNVYLNTVSYTHLDVYKRQP